ncbi:MAG: hypothetical protein LC096_05125 [Bacteroidia bacterium]|nr:hypothetical protein [Bacteroidia bacterium]
MRYYFLSFILVCCFLKSVNAQIGNTVIGADATALGGITTGQYNAYSAMNNPALMANITNWQAGIFSEQRYGLKELNFSNLSLVIPTKSIHFGAVINYFGFANYNQQQFTFSTAKKLNESFSLGAQINYQLTNIIDYGSAGAWIIAVGLHYKPINNIALSGYIYNPTQQKYGNAVSDKIPAFFRLGMVYNVNKLVDVLAEGEQTLEQKFNLKAGVRYQIHPRIGFGVGFNSFPTAFHFGSSVRFNSLMIDIAAGIHQTLGVIPQFGLRFPVK